MGRGCSAPTCACADGAGPRRAHRHHGFWKGGAGRLRLRRRAGHLSAPRRGGPWIRIATSASTHAADANSRGTPIRSSSYTSLGVRWTRQCFAVGPACLVMHTDTAWLLAIECDRRAVHRADGRMRSALVPADRLNRALCRVKKTSKNACAGRTPSLIFRSSQHTWGHSSAGRALAWHARGRRFDPGWLHQLFRALGLSAKATSLSASPSSRGLGHHPFTVATGVRIPVGTPFLFARNLKSGDAGLFLCGVCTCRRNRVRFRFCQYTWGHSSAGRALAWHARGRRFDPGWLHQLFRALGLSAKATSLSASPSSRGLGHHPFTVATGVRIPVGTPSTPRHPALPGVFLSASRAPPAPGRRRCRSPLRFSAAACGSAGWPAGFPARCGRRRSRFPTPHRPDARSSRARSRRPIAPAARADRGGR